MKLNENLFRDFVAFSKKQLQSRDIDPMYYVLESVFDQRDYDEETRLWYLFLYVAFYHVGSAEIIFSRYQEKTTINPEDEKPLPTGIERRGFRGNLKWIKTINHLEQYFSMEDFISPINMKGKLGWKAMRIRFESIPNNGPWASYKFADLLAHVMHYDIEADDLGNNPAVLGCAETLTGLKAKYIENSPEIQNELFTASIGAGVKFSGLDQLETCLCDFHTMLDGRYYVGNDIDMNMKQIPDDDKFWKAREDSFHKLYLGEKCGWDGERKDMKKRYVERQII